jgi:hypothetical protein
MNKPFYGLTVDTKDAQRWQENTGLVNSHQKVEMERKEVKLSWVTKAIVKDRFRQSQESWDGW